MTGSVGQFRLYGRANLSIDRAVGGRYACRMKAVEFTTELKGSNVLEVPLEVAAQLPKAGRARVIILTSEENEEAEWRRGAYEQFLREDPPEDTIYENLR
jgi:hypothetical protein